MNSLWQKYKFEEGEIFTSSIGYYQFWIRKLNKIWQIAVQKMDEPEKGMPEQLHEEAKVGKDIEWNHDIVDKHSHLHLIPATPDRPIIIKSVKEISILPDMSLDIYIEVPVWVQLYSSSIKAQNLMLEFPSNDLSSTWFGEPDNGELAYSYPYDIHYSPDTILAKSGFAVCPIRIKNESETTLDFQRLSVPIVQLNLYANDKMLCTNEINVRYKGEVNSSEIQIAGSNPSLSEGLKLINNARIKSNRNFLKKSFSFIKSFADY